MSTIPMFVSTKLDLILVATQVLHDIDPANTFCNVNEDMEDEYCNEASLMAEYFIDHNMMLKNAIFRTFNEQFGKNNYDEAKLKKAYRKINDYLV